MKGRKDIAFCITLGVSILIFVAGFLVPPLGVIDPSCLKAGGILLGFYSLHQIPQAIKAGKEIRIKHGDTSVSVGDGADLNNIENND